MGWTFYPNYSRKEMIDNITSNWSRTTDDGIDVNGDCLAHCYRGGPTSGCLWSVWDIKKTQNGVTETDRFIRLDLIRRMDKEWGHKDMEESMHPYYYTCPLKYLDMVPPDEYPKSVNEEWRKGVRECYRRTRGPEGMKVGDIVTIREGWTFGRIGRVDEVRITSLRPLQGVRVDMDRPLLSLKRAMLKDIVKSAPVR